MLHRLQEKSGPWVGMRVVIASLLLGACCSRAAGALPRPQPAREVVTVGVFSMAPYVMPGDGAPSGALIDFFDHEIAPRMGVRFAWQRPMTTARLERSIMVGSVTFTPILARTPARLRARVQFAGEPHLRFDPVIAVLPDSPITTLTSPADLAGVTVGWVEAGALPSFMLDRRVRLDRIGNLDWTASNLEKLRVGRIGAAYFSNPHSPAYVAAQAGLKIRLINVPGPGPLLYGAFAPGAPAHLAQRYRKAAAQAFAGDAFARYLQKAMAPVVALPPAVRTGEDDQ